MSSAESVGQFYRRRLEDLLAILNRDGGHYTGDHGIDSSCDHAESMYYRRIQFFQDALYRIEGMCGLPDPAEACRAILAFCKETMTQDSKDANHA